MSDSLQYREFFKHAVIDRGSPKINFIGFMQCILGLILIKYPGSHPLNHLMSMVSGSSSVKRKAFSSIPSEEAKLAAEIGIIQRRPFRSFDIYSGPNLVALLEEKPGWIQMLNGAVTKHGFVNFKQYDEYVGESIVKHIEVSASFDHILTRIIKSGFDVAASQDPRTRTPTGRCWHILSKSKEQIGVLWDYPGQLSSVVWQPVHDKRSPSFTLTLYDWSSANYRGNRDPNSVTFSKDFMNGCHIFAQSESISSARFQIESYGYKLVTRLYKLL